ncbi:MAG: hypothetical protein AAF959_15520 [Cyanobacteria bacterium P01_D01_bin.56]
MSFPKLLKTLLLGLISLFGALILIGLAVWCHYWWYGALNPEQVRPAEDWELALGIGSFFIQLSASVETLLISLITRFRWIMFNRGRFAAALFSLLSLAYAMPAFRNAITDSSINFWWVLLYELAIMLPILLAWCLLRVQHVHRIHGKLRVTD